MATTYILQAVDTNLYDMVVHGATPVGNNSAGIAWSTCIVNSGLNFTRMVTGSGAGQISTADANAIASGSMIEGSFRYADDPTLTLTQRQTAIAAQANQVLTALKATLQAKLQWFGQTVTTT